MGRAKVHAHIFGERLVTRVAQIEARLMHALDVVLLRVGVAPSPEAVGQRSGLNNDIDDIQ